MSEPQDSEVLFPWENQPRPLLDESTLEGTDAAEGEEADTQDAGTDAPDAAAAGSAAPGGTQDDHAQSESGIAGMGAQHAQSDEQAESETEEDEARFSVLKTEVGRKASERTAALLRERPVAPKEYYAISEVCDIVGLKPHVLRYWETQFQVLNPSKNRSGNRVYQRKEIKLILLVKHLLYEEKFTVEGAKARLEQMRRGGAVGEATGGVVDREMLDLLRADVSELAALLAPSKSV